MTELNPGRVEFSDLSTDETWGKVDTDGQFVQEIAVDLSRLADCMQAIHNEDSHAVCDLAVVDHPNDDVDQRLLLLRHRGTGEQWALSGRVFPNDGRNDGGGPRCPDCEDLDLRVADAVYAECPVCGAEVLREEVGL